MIRINMIFTFGSQLFQHCVDNNVCAGATDLMMVMMTMTIDDDDSDADNDEK